jgi:hypothetical protein
MMYLGRFAHSGFFRAISILLLVLFLWLVLLYFFTPEMVIDYIGIEHAYIIIFCIALICGFSSLSGSMFYVAIVTLSSGGADSFLLGIVGGLGLALSDGIFFYVVKIGLKQLPPTGNWFRLQTRAIVTAIPDWALGVSIYLYCAVSPIPNDILLAALALSGARAQDIAVYVFLGDISSALLWAYIGK